MENKHVYEVINDELYVTTEYKGDSFEEAFSEYFFLKAHGHNPYLYDNDTQVLPE